MSFVNLLVLRCADVSRTRAFYECFGLEFEEHQHGNGAVHSGTMDGMGLILELYPASEKNPADRCGLGFGTPDLNLVTAALIAQKFEPGNIERQPWGLTFVVRDPDGRRVEVKHEPCDGDPEIEEKLKARVEALDRGEVKTIPASEVIERLNRTKNQSEP